MTNKMKTLTIIGIAVVACLVIGPVNVFKGAVFLAIAYWVYTLATGDKQLLYSAKDKVASLIEELKGNRS